MRMLCGHPGGVTGMRQRSCKGCKQIDKGGCDAYRVCPNAFFQKSVHISDSGPRFYSRMTSLTSKIIRLDVLRSIRLC